MGVPGLVVDAYGFGDRVLGEEDPDFVCGGGGFNGGAGEEHAVGEDGGDEGLEGGVWGEGAEGEPPGSKEVREPGDGGFVAVFLEELEGGLAGCGGGGLHNGGVCGVVGGGVWFRSNHFD